jgi:hypothetical protein
MGPKKIRSAEQSAEYDFRVLRVERYRQNSSKNAGNGMRDGASSWPVVASASTRRFAVKATRSLLVWSE